MSGETVRRHATLGPSGHIDTFARDNLPPPDLWPDFLLDRPEFQYPDWINVGVELSDRLVEKGLGDHIALIGNGRVRTYKELSDWTNRLAHALVEDFGVKPGNRVLVRSGNNPAMVAAWLAATKAGAVVVNTMPMLRAGELTQIIDKAEISLALTDSPAKLEVRRATTGQHQNERVRPPHRIEVGREPGNSARMVELGPVLVDVPIDPFRVNLRPRESGAGRRVAEVVHLVTGLTQRLHDGRLHLAPPRRRDVYPSSAGDLADAARRRRQRWPRRSRSCRLSLCS